MATLLATVHTPVGKFVGTLTQKPGTAEEVAKFRDNLQRELNNMSFVVMYDEDGDEITFPGDLVKQSVWHFEILR